jgi:ubiquinone/menaquinone biosynthesis C-methylase UbiE
VLGRRSLKPERIDTGDYTPEEYRRFLSDIAFINRYFGEAHALRRSLFRQIADAGLERFSVLDVGCGSGEVLRQIGNFAAATNRRASLTGIDINALSISETAAQSVGEAPITAIRGDALQLPFADRSFDFAISSLFFHHLTDSDAAKVLAEMKRVARQSIFVIDLHRHAAALFFYKILCTAFRISPLVREDGSLSIRRAFRPAELRAIADQAGIKNASVARSLPFRLILHG